MGGAGVVAMLQSKLVGDIKSIAFVGLSVGVIGLVFILFPSSKKVRKSAPSVD